MRVNQIQFLVYLLALSMAQNYMLSLTYPSAFDNNCTNINAIGTDDDGNFLVSL